MFTSFPTSSRTRSVLAFAAVLTVASLPATSQAITYTWKTAGGGDWNSSANWTPSTGPAGVPTAADTALFNIGTTTPITVNVNPGDIATVITFDTVNAASYTIGASTAQTLILSDTTRTINVNAAVARDQLFNAAIRLGNTNPSAGTTFTVSNNSAALLTFAGGFSGETSTAARTLSFGGSGTGSIVVSGAISTGSASSLAVLKNSGSTNTLVLSGANTYTGATTIERGTIKLDFSATGAPTDNIINNGLATGGSGLTLGRSANNNSNAGTLQIVGSTAANAVNSQRFNGLTLSALTNALRVSESAGNTVNVSLGAISRGSNGAFIDFTLPTNGAITTTTTTNTGGLLTTTNGAFATVDGTDWVSNNAGTLGKFTAYDSSNVDVTADGAMGTSINSLRFNQSTSKTLTLSGTHTIASGGILLTSASNGAVIGSTSDTTSKLISGASKAINIANYGSGTLTINASIGNSTSGVSDLLINGDTKLTGVSTFTGTSRIVGGTTTITDAGALGGTSAAMVVYTGATLALDGTNGAIDLPNTKSISGINGTGATGQGALRNIAGNNFVRGNIAFSNSSGTIYSDAGKLTLTSSTTSITANNGTVTFDGAGDFEIVGSTQSTSNDSSGSDFIKNGSGTLYFASTNVTNKQANWRINGGIVDVRVDQLNTSASTPGLEKVTIVSDGILEINGGVNADTTTLTRPVLFTGNGGVAARNGKLIVDRGGAQAAVSWGAGNFYATGLSMSFGSSLADNVVEFRNPLNLNNGVRTIRVLDNVNSTGDSALMSGSITSTTAASGGLIKEGAGLLTLTGTASSYTGATTINAGTLAVGLNGVGALGNTAVAVNSTGTLGGSGTIGGTVSVNGGGTISPGNSAGNLTTGAETWKSAGTYNWELTDPTTTAGSGWDLLTINGALTLSSSDQDTFKIAIVGSPSNAAIAGFDPEASYQFLIADSTSTISGFDPTLFNVDPALFNASNANGGTWSIHRGDEAGITNGDSSQLYLTYAVPEPTSAAVFALGVLGLLSRRRRRA